MGYCPPSPKSLLTHLCDWLVSVVISDWRFPATCFLYLGIGIMYSRIISKSPVLKSQKCRQSVQTSKGLISYVCPWGNIGGSTTRHHATRRNAVSCPSNQ